MGSSPWYKELWRHRDRIEDKPALLLWGAKDPAFGKYLGRWKEQFPAARVVTFPDAGHFVQEEQADHVGPLVRAFLRELP